MDLHGQMSRTEFLHIVRATTMCFITFRADLSQPSKAAPSKAAAPGPKPKAYMVLGDLPDMEQGIQEDEPVLCYLDSGCNQTCHGERWRERYTQTTGYDPEWLTQETRPMTGIGGSTRTNGVKQFFVSLETLDGPWVPGEIMSTEIADSDAPMLLSLQAQEALGLVLDLARGTVYSSILGLTFRAVRGRNRLIGLRMLPSEESWEEVPVALMADEDPPRDPHDRTPLPRRRAESAPGAPRKTRTVIARSLTPEQPRHGVTLRPREEVGDRDRPRRDSRRRSRSPARPSQPSIFERHHPNRRVTDDGYVLVDTTEQELAEAERGAKEAAERRDRAQTPVKAKPKRPESRARSIAQAQAKLRAKAEAAAKMKSEPGTDATPKVKAEPNAKAKPKIISRIAIPKVKTRIRPAAKRTATKTGAKSKPKATALAASADPDDPIDDEDFREETDADNADGGGGDDPMPPPGPPPGGAAVAASGSSSSAARPAEPAGYPTEDFWLLQDEDGEHRLLRHHVQERHYGKFHPGEALASMPIDISRLTSTRLTMKIYESQTTTIEEIDDWTVAQTPQPEKEPWKGVTIFYIKPIEEEIQEQSIDLGDAPKKWMSRGQRRHFDSGLKALEEEDVAMWSALRGHRPSMPRGWKALLEIFAGCAVLTSVFQSQGYETCRPLDINNGWDVFDQRCRREAEELFEKERPYLVSFAWPCGPWSPWQRMAVDQDTVQEKRRLWLPVFKWIRQMVRKQRRRGGVVLMENPWQSEAWYCSEVQSMVHEDGMDTHYIDMCAFGLKDYDSGTLHLKPTCILTDSPGIGAELYGRVCSRDHPHQPLEGANSQGSRCQQAGRYTRQFCNAVLRGIQHDLQAAMGYAFAAEDFLEEREEEQEEGLLDAVVTAEDLRPSAPNDTAKMLETEEALDSLHREADPDTEKLRKAEWLKLTKQERIGIRRLHHMTSHSTKPQMQRMLTYAHASPHVIRGVRHFRCPACQRIEEEKRPAVVRPPSPYTFNQDVGLDIFVLHDSQGVSFQVLHVMCLGTCFHSGEVLGESHGVPASSKCLEVFLRTWLNWAGTPETILVDRGTHNRGVMMGELEKRGVRFRLVATESPHQLGRIERGGGILKGMMKRVIVATNATGDLEMGLVLQECLQTKNRLASVAGFSPAQWVLGKNIRTPGWGDETDEQEATITDEDPASIFNRRNAIREMSKQAWAHEDSHRRVRAAMLRKGGSPEDEFRPGDMVAFKRKQRTGGWVGPARVIARDDKNYWLLHSGIPILISSNRIRGANAEEMLETELLQKSRLRKRPFMDREAVQPVSAPPAAGGSGGQRPFIDLRKEPEDDGYNPLDGSPVKVRRKPRLPPAAEVPVPEDPNDLEALTTPTSKPTKTEERFFNDGETPDYPVLSLEEASARGAEILMNDELLSDIRAQDEPASSSTDRRPTLPLGNQLDVGSERASQMRIPEIEINIPPAAIRPRSRSPREEQAAVARSTAFLAFMAKRKGPDVNELNFNRVDDGIRERLCVSRSKEWGNWMQYKAIRFPTDEEVQDLLAIGTQAIPMKWVDLDKNEKLRVPGGPEVPEKWKSRLVCRGDLEREQFRTDCPTASHTTIHILLSYAACKGYKLNSGDISAAFVQGSPIERTLLLRAPRDGIQVDPTDRSKDIAPHAYMVALMSVYGSRDAPRGFWLELRGTMINCGLNELDPAFYALVHDGTPFGLLCSHVDDLLWAGTTEMDELMDRVQERFTFGSKDVDNFRFCGRRVETTPEAITISSPESLAKVKPIHIDGGRERQPSDLGSEEEKSQMHAVLGSIGWVARLCRPELCYRTSALQGKQNKPRVEDLRETNKLLAASQKTKDNGINFKKNIFDFDTALLLSVTDASHAAETSYEEDGGKKGYRSQGGRVLLLADRMPDLNEGTNCHILEWQSASIKRVCRSTLQAEVLSSMVGSESAQQVRYLLHSLYVPRPQGDRGAAWKIGAADSRVIAWVTDCYSYLQYLGSIIPNTVSDKRLAIDLTALRQELWRRPGEEIGDPSKLQGLPEEAPDRLFWICTADMVSDALTKAMRWDALRDLCTTSHWTLRGSRHVRAGFGSTKTEECQKV